MPWTSGMVQAAATSGVALIVRNNLVRILQNRFTHRQKIFKRHFVDAFN